MSRMLFPNELFIGQIKLKIIKRFKSIKAECDMVNIMESWVADNLKEDCYFAPTTYDAFSDIRIFDIRFKNIDDAILFKLVWG